MINGAHVIVYSGNTDADRAFIRDVLKFKHIDVHGGWLIFKLPPAELAVHPSDENDLHELYLMTDDLDLGDRDSEEGGSRMRVGVSAEVGTVNSHSAAWRRESGSSMSLDTRGHEGMNCVPSIPRELTS